MTDTTFRRGPLAVLLTGTFLIVLDFFVVNVALPSMQRDLARRQHHSRVARRRLRPHLRRPAARRQPSRRPVGTAAHVHVSASRSSWPAPLACGLAPDTGTLMAARLVQGAAAAAIGPTVLVPDRGRVRRGRTGSAPSAPTRP